ncbi:DVU3141 family protein [Roseicella aquatilis]|nr:DVU3141 family protein [Roseicella aquatilis]
MVWSRAAVLAGLVLTLVACAGRQPTAVMAESPAAAPQPGDALGEFLAGARQGQEAVVPLPGGGTGPVRVMRAYVAASGRECREVLIGGAGRASLLCQADGQWVTARPLLQGGSMARP